MVSLIQFDFAFEHFDFLYFLIFPLSGRVQTQKTEIGMVEIFIILCYYYFMELMFVNNMVNPVIGKNQILVIPNGKPL